MELKVLWDTLTDKAKQFLKSQDDPGLIHRVQEAGKTMDLVMVHPGTKYPTNRHERRKLQKVSRGK